MTYDVSNGILRSKEKINICGDFEGWSKFQGDQIVGNYKLKI